MNIDVADISDALLAPLVQDHIALPDQARILIVNSVYTSDLNNLLQQYQCDFVQHFKPYADGFLQGGYDVVCSLDGVESGYDAIFVQVPKNKLEAQYFLAKSIDLLADNGMLVCCAHNKAGGNRLVKMLTEFGGQGIANLSMNKCRSVWASGFGSAADGSTRQQALDAGARQAVCDGTFVSQAGVYGWDKIDKGSQLLLDHMPDKFSARRVADFGCGYGYLSRYLVQHLSAPYKLYVIDADARAVDLCRENLCLPDGGVVEPLWADIVSGTDLPKNLDLIVMNPPFHEGKKSDASIGQAFVARAAQSLRAKGTLYMVANVHLPYERELSQYFSKVEKLHEGQGFKVYKAVK